MWPTQAPGGSSPSSPTDGHVRCHHCSLRTVLDSTHSAQPASAVAWGRDQGTLAQAISTVSNSTAPVVQTAGGRGLLVYISVAYMACVV
jgi:hypothetical protein